MQEQTSSTPQNSPENPAAKRAEVLGASQQQLDALRGNVEEGKRREILEQLQSAKDAQARVETFAYYADKWGLEAVIGTFIPALGDMTNSAIASMYLMLEAHEAGLGTYAYLKIASLQTADSFVGAMPLVGDIADYFFTANSWVVGLFESRVKELESSAKELGIAQAEIDKLKGSALSLPKLLPSS